MTPDEIRRVLDTLRTNSALQSETNLEGRAEALDTLRFVRQAVHFLPSGPERRALATRAAVLRRRWQQIDQRVFATVRAQIRSGVWRGVRLRQELGRYTRYDGQPRRAHYDLDGLDVLVAGLLRTEPLPHETFVRSDEMVHLEPTPARALLELVDRVPMGVDDLFYDLGSGLGEVVILVHLLTGVRARGIEIQPTFCEYARRCAAQFDLTGVEFIHADARELTYEDGTVFYLFTPFIGTTLRTVLNRLQHVAALHPITVCTLGPCTPTVCAQPWLRSIDDVEDLEHEFKLAIFKSIWR
ncbi:MAG: hypothetical protein N3A53_07915 [Verrucomicrobiae bacterium]|nr:hypothetical protein [Verrucomicrobiae bacterium]